MTTFGKRLRECREAKKLSQQDIAKKMNTSYTVIGKYERDEMIPSVEVAKTLAKLMDTTVGYLLGEAKQADTFKDPAMLKRLNDITNLPDADKEHVLYTIDHLLASVKTKQSYK